ncbi:MAG: protein-glutamate O-methyltransferase CheR [Treponemataceae bacterium]|nr:MAG: protein-glutamate O-methyltransferase CheR [Treponemataceae bacterium]
MSDVLTDAMFEKFRKAIYDESCITFSETNRSVLDSRLKEQLRQKKLTSLDDYLRLIMGSKEEMKEFLDAVTTNLTRFFRNQAHFDALVHYVIPAVLEEKKKTGSRYIKVWSAGCSTGEEPYTIAMILQDILPPSFNFEIIASDISLKSIMVAKTGFYPTTRIDGVPAAYLSRFFIKTEPGYQVINELKNRIRFDYHNLRHDSGLKQIDIVFCRNVLIYFDDEGQKLVVNRFWDAMSPKSYLYIGHSESLFGMDTKFGFLKTEWATLYSKAV